MDHVCEKVGHHLAVIKVKWIALQNVVPLETMNSELLLSSWQRNGLRTGWTTQVNSLRQCFFFCNLSAAVFFSLKTFFSFSIWFLIKKKETRGRKIKKIFIKALNASQIWAIGCKKLQKKKNKNKWKDWQMSVRHISVFVMHAWAIV